ncbi:multiple epidermal growth factor-like domains protein 10, partial [Patella vulgata]|uniref:multiple epidermal growth factor-like domains protein 10 n=1 Tax=Patella vulgata TaxID=6465 RepID=UPI0024A7B401
FTVTNVAYNKPTNQSSTYVGFSGDTRSLPSHAVDGNTDNHWEGEHCTHTADNTGSDWWCVDLQQIYNIDSIKLFNRDRFQERLSGFEIKISSGDQCNESGFNSATSCHNDTSPTAQSIYNIESCDQQQSISARTVFISVNNEVVTLCEVQIFSDPIQCNTGYYSTSSSTCQPCNTCLNDKCDPDTGVCTDGCEATYYGDKCTSLCSDKCTNSRCSTTSPSSQLQCTDGCVDGNTGPYCQSSCPANCRTCQQYGSSCNECNQGWYGTKCESQCSDGCVNNMCNKLAGTCVCIATYYGDKCTSPCSDKCTNSRCYNPSSPSQRQCTDGCVDGNTGPYCQSSCPANCRSCQQDGSSCNECNEGWYGTNCESQCPGNCVGGCGKIDGRCNDCKPDTAGPYCNITCGTGCQPTTDLTECDRNGKCKDCIIGRYGNGCDLSCSTGCDGGCDRDTGRCTTCIVGRYGNGCDLKCSTGCDGGCDRNDGKCTSCIKGKTGDRCDINCNNNCTVCNQDNANSCTECKDGRWGSSCNKLCNINCKPVVGTTVGKCDQITGNCINGCLPGKIGSNCITDCEAGKYGENCESKCGNCAQNTVCDGVSGTCGLNGCADGFHGSRCQEKIVECTSISPIVIGIIGVLCGIVGTVAVGVSYHFYKKRCQSSQPKAENDPNYVYCNTDLNPTTSTTDDTLTTGYQNVPTNTRNVDYVNQSFNTEDNTRNTYDTLDPTPDNTQHTYTTLGSNKVNKAKH